MALRKSKAEERADLIRKAVERGRATIKEAAAILDKSWPTVKGLVDLGEIESLKYGKRTYVPLSAFDHLGVTLPQSIAGRNKEQAQAQFTIDSNLIDPEQYYD